jgi:hypothetical protein
MHCAGMQNNSTASVYIFSMKLLSLFDHAALPRTQFNHIFDNNIRELLPHASVGETMELHILYLALL